ncbi:unnamed protein product [Cuscuta campestris]|uniref:CCHC-type domain-containing protein n=1 Tax=Cuscuta campestris TaxID=132261 RepID=A0A484M1X8_9ASTE|nr:unnamed protein product [Cuscuta campestris]
MSQESAHGQGNNEHVSVHTEASSFTTPVQNEPVNQQNVENNPNGGGQPDLVIPAFLANVLQQIANAPMFQPPPPPPPRVITYKTLRDNGADLFLGDRIGEPQIAWDWIKQTARVLEDLNVPMDNYPRLASQLLRKEAYEWWKRTDESAGTPKPWTWAHFEWAFKKKLRPDLRSRVSILTTVDFAEAYDLIARADSDLSACIEYLKTNNVSSNTHRPTGSASKGKRPFQEPSNSHFSKKGKSVQTQSMASVDKSKKRRYPACEHCGRNHPGECWLKQGLCLGCGKPGHFRKECPTNPGEPYPPAPVVSQAASARPAPSQRSTAGSNPAKNQNQQQGRAPARTYAMKARIEESPDEERTRFLTFFSKRVVALLRIVPERLPEMLGYDFLDVQLHQIGLWPFVSKARKEINPALIQAFYSNLQREDDVIYSLVKSTPIELIVERLGRIAGLPYQGDDISTYGGEDWVCNTRLPRTRFTRDPTDR